MNTGRFYLILFCAIFIASCGNDLQEKNTQLEKENKRLQAELIVVQVNAKKLAKTIHEVHVNQARIELSKQKVNQLLAQGRGKSGASKKLIIKEMQLVNTLQEINESKIRELHLTGDSSFEIDEDMASVVAELEEYKSFEDEAMGLVRDRLVGLNYEMELLNETLDSVTFMSEINSGVMELQAADLNTAYYCIGNFKTLSEQKIIERKGGVAGFGSVPVILKDFNKSKFTSIDINQIQEIELTTVKVELLSTHPSGSYKILDNGKQKVILIDNPMQFWGTTRYLIILEKR
ncbi:MAG: hypothetical protein JKY42_07295 [Flavobacteriales bacterium]|nr:hypothetical protein [Flavobacteriales bacterium]